MLLHAPVQWERLSVEDGTGPNRDYRGAVTWHEKDLEERELRYKERTTELTTPPGAMMASSL